MFQKIAENQLNHFVFRFFGKEILSIPKTVLTRPYYNFFYTLTLLRLRKESKKRKIRVGFWVTEPSKWTCRFLYNELKNDEHFEPFVMLSYFKRPQEDIYPKEHYKKSKEFFEKQGVKIYDAYDVDTGEFKELQEFKPDIIFYQQPWLIPEKQVLAKNYKKSLLCYIPYCFYSLDSYVNYLPKFHGVMWKYFVESALHKEDYEKKYSAKNCVNLGSTKLDEYYFLTNKNKPEDTNRKKTIIYAPHHSFNDNIHDFATFRENGQFILELAKNHSEYDWIFRPHPVLKDRVIKNSIMTKEEIEDYYKEWEKVGRISTGGNYCEMFLASDLLITDCISFLAEYAPTLKPVFHLRKDFLKEDFNNLVKEIDKSYYQVFSNEELEELFNKVVVVGNDNLKQEREKNRSLLLSDKSASERIYSYLKNSIL